MRHMRTAAIAAIAILAASCGWKRTAVPIIADTGSEALLVGQWSGEYGSRDTGRSGSITFDMASEKDTAYCDIVMVPKVNAFQTGGPERANGSVIVPEALAQPLKIRFIRLGEGRVSGTLDPYIDPECNCRVTTTFQGKITTPNTIEGTYTTRGAGIQTSSGTWKVNRQRTSASTR